MPHRPSPPCIISPSGEPHTSFLHLEQLSRDDKTKWILAANQAGIPLAEWVQQALNRTARAELAPPPNHPPSLPPTA